MPFPNAEVYCSTLETKSDCNQNPLSDCLWVARPGVFKAHCEFHNNTVVPPTMVNTTESSVECHSDAVKPLVEPAPVECNYFSPFGVDMCDNLNNTECQTYDSRQDGCIWVPGRLFPPRLESCRCNNNPEAYCSILETKSDCLVTGAYDNSYCTWIFQLVY